MHIMFVVPEIVDLTRKPQGILEKKKNLYSGRLLVRCNFPSDSFIAYMQCPCLQYIVGKLKLPKIRIKCVCLPPFHCWRTIFLCYEMNNNRIELQGTGESNSICIEGCFCDVMNSAIIIPATALLRHFQSLCKVRRFLKCLLPLNRCSLNTILWVFSLFFTWSTHLIDHQNIALSISYDLI